MKYFKVFLANEIFQKNTVILFWNISSEIFRCNITSYEWCSTDQRWVISKSALHNVSYNQCRTRNTKTDMTYTISLSKKWNLGPFKYQCSSTLNSSLVIKLKRRQYLFLLVILDPSGVNPCWPLLLMSNAHQLLWLLYWFGCTTLKPTVFDGTLPTL